MSQLGQKPLLPRRNIDGRFSSVKATRSPASAVVEAGAAAAT
jgi:hypothetical protein